MRIETELDEIHAKRLLELQHHSNKSLPQLVADILIKALDETTFPPETEGQKVLRILKEHDLLGCMEGDGRLAVDYKKYLWGQE
ncbi:MAG: hypothetical protein WAU60_11585 [Candidatus Competibacter denitrificans]|jgi:hypothetical protein|uniref:CopG-like domain-containing protein DNA-binding n=1 Tax=Candidatus Competibacter denitrificans Run_A_D11 TaxID=1400863 RepID=W6M4K6_9GAMM|nr:hypothetical protein [Candidatus Competibacter denitrificans]CDI00755.1 putative CopG-like domain-containing protein DNA-binding [Candidatus Competibacter denitrificans Run_A_D11]HAS87012.1 hypothetical protein [Candidatus Competibacteraceae bacterium]